MRPLNEDTLGDKVFRFVIGAVLGAGMGWLLAIRWSVVDGGEFGRLILGGAGLLGILAVPFGNAFIEGFIQHRWWSGWWH